MANRDGRRSGPRNPLGPQRSEGPERTTILSEAVREEPRASTEGASTAGKIVGSDGFKRDGAAHRLSPKSKETWSAEPRRQCNQHRVMRNNEDAQGARTTQAFRPAHNPLPQHGGDTPPLASVQAV